MSNLPKPVILREGTYSGRDLEKLESECDVFETRDIYVQQLTELFEITHPEFKFSETYKKRVDDFVKEKINEENTGDWIYFPWNKVLLHTIDEEGYHLLQTNRNRNIITAEEQKKLLNLKIGVIGLSIGGGMAVTMAYNGIGNVMKITDHDILTTTNLNRLRGGIHQIGEPKIKIISQQIYEVNPYAHLITFPKGLNKDSLGDFIENDPKPDLIFEEVDDFEIKIRIRIVAREAGIPVIMLTNLGDRLLIDIERYDLDRKIRIFNGLDGGIADQILSKPISEEDKKRYALQIVGLDNIPGRVVESVKEVGKTLAGRPQLMSTVSIGSGVAALLARKFALNEDLPSGRRLIKFDDIFK